MQEPSGADPRLCWAACLGWLSGPCCTYSVDQGEVSQPSETEKLQPTPPAIMPPGRPCFIWKCTWKLPCEHPFYLTAKITNRVVFLQGNLATKQHGVTFLWVGSAQHVAHGLFGGLFGTAWFRVPSIKRDPRWLSLINRIFKAILERPSASRTQIITEQYLLAQNKLSMFHFMAPVSGSSHASLWGVGLRFPP